MVKVKICGITNLNDALSAADSGCDALGFVFYKKSPRYITPGQAREIIRRLPKDIITIGVFANAQEKTIKKTADLCGLDMLQFHGNESARFCDRFKGYRVIKAFRVYPAHHPKEHISKMGRVRDKIPETVSRYTVFAYLFDTLADSKLGGTGKSFDWRLLRHLRGIGRPVFLSGGLNPGNVSKAIECAQPQWVDVSSGVEAKPGKKDPRKIRKFLARAKNRKGKENAGN